MNAKGLSLWTTTRNAQQKQTDDHALSESRAARANQANGRRRRDVTQSILRVQGDTQRDRPGTRAAACGGRGRDYDAARRAGCSNVQSMRLRDQGSDRLNLRPETELAEPLEMRQMRPHVREITQAPSSKHLLASSHRDSRIPLRKDGRLRDACSQARFATLRRPTSSLLTDQFLLKPGRRFIPSRIDRHDREIF